MTPAGGAANRQQSNAARASELQVLSSLARATAAVRLAGRQLSGDEAVRFKRLADALLTKCEKLIEEDGYGS